MTRERHGIPSPELVPARPSRLLEVTRAAVSGISFHEIGYKVRLGKCPERTDHVTGLRAWAREDGYDLVPFTAGAAMLDRAHRDFFDRMIAAVARAEGLPLLFSDTAFDAPGLARVWC